MGMAEPSRDLEERVTRVEDAVQEFRFVHMTKTDAQTAGMGILYAGQQRLEHMLVGFRAETAAEFGAVHAELDAVKAEQARQRGLIEEALEILRRSPEQGPAS
jgi:hypothetical protein